MQADLSEAKEILVQLREAIQQLEDRVIIQDDLLSYAWTIIANGGEGNWDRTSPDWHLAAITWRDRYHALLDVYGVGSSQVEEPV